jgi:hypothetical protein
MLRLKKTVLAASAVAALALAPVTPAAAVGLVPWIVGRHVVGAVLGLAMLPFAVASAALGADQPAAPYPPTPDYGGPSPGYSAPPNYYARPPVYYAPAPAYYARRQTYYQPGVSYARPLSRFYEAPRRGYYAPRSRYIASYGAHVPHRSGSFAYRRR